VAGRDFLELTVRDWLEALSSADPVPGSGSAAAMGGAVAAAVVAMTARASEDWPEAPGIAAQALRLRDRLAELAQADAEAYGASLQALASTSSEPDERRDFALGTALREAAQVPLVIAETAADVALLAAEAAERATPELQPDARAATSLASASAAAAAHLVEINLATTPDDERVRRARAAASAAAEVQSAA
jgi:formiminotetrahydrofolate cyclodeaminase